MSILGKIASWIVARFKGSAAGHAAGNAVDADVASTIKAAISSNQGSINSAIDAGAAYIKGSALNSLGAVQTAIKAELATLGLPAEAVTYLGSIVDSVAAPDGSADQLASAAIDQVAAAVKSAVASAAGSNSGSAS